MTGCLTPITLYRKERGRDDKHTQVVPCGRCPNCIKRRISMWSFRLQEEMKVSVSSSFITLTYDDDHLPFSENGLMTLDKRDHQLFMKKLRKHLHSNRFKYGIYKDTKLKYYAVGEYGSDTYRPHYHYIMFNLPEKLILDQSIIEAIWDKGRVQVAVCNPKTINYVVGYVNKRNFANTVHPDDDRLLECSMMSKGLGKNFLTKRTVKFYQQLMEPYLIQEDGIKRAMPRYYRHKIFNDYQRKILAEKSAAHAEENYPFKDAKHEVDYVQNEFTKHRRMQKLKRKNI